MGAREFPIAMFCCLKKKQAWRPNKLCCMIKQELKIDHAYDFNLLLFIWTGQQPAI